MKIFLLFLSLFLANCSKDWSYKSNNGSQNWGDIKPEFKFCKVGYNQSPIDISSEMFQESNDNIVTTNYGNSEFEKIRQKYFMKINIFGKNFVQRKNKKFYAKYLEFHHPSEHHVDAVPHSLEMQIYHKSDDEQWLVLSYFLELNLAKIEDNNQNFADLIGFLNSKEKEFKTDLKKLITNNENYFFYEGSFTTPPCKEGLKWYVYKEPIYLSKKQINQIIKSAIFTNYNARNIQKYNPSKF
ncbi:MAG: carbonic anhydrase family protein [Rickettsiales bacterium]